MIDLPRSTFYYRKQQRPKSDKALLALIQKTLEEFVCYGYRRVTASLRRDGVLVNRKRVYRVMKENRLLCPKKKRFKVYTTDSNHPYPVHPNLIKDLSVLRLNQVWVADLTYIRIATSFVYLAVIMEIRTRMRLPRVL